MSNQNKTRLIWFALGTFLGGWVLGIVAGIVGGVKKRA